MKLFDPESPMMIALGKLADVIICNILFVLFSLPVITAGASLAALYTCMQRLVEDDERDEGLIFQTFWWAFKDNFRQGTLLWLICLAAMLFLGAYYWITQSMAGSLGRMYQVTFFLLVLLFLFGFLYVFPLQARYRNSVRNTLRNAWLMSVAALPWTLLALALVVAALFLTFYMNRDMNTALYIWAVGGFGLVAYLQSFFFRRAFRKLSPEQLHPKKEQAEGAIFTDEEHRTEDLMVSASSFSDPNWNRRDDLFPEEKKKTVKRRRR